MSSPLSPVDASILSLREVAYAYPQANGRVLDGVDLDILPGHRLGLFGPNGCGKTTLLSVMMGLLPPQAGEVRFAGRPVAGERDLWDLRCAVGLVLQHADDQILFPTVLDDVAFGPLNLGLAPADARQRALETLDFLGLAGFENRLAHKLSGGEKKLVTLAGVLAMRPRALLLDEPTASLDPATRDRLVDILARIEAAVLVVSHDWDFLARTGREFYTICNGRLVREDAARIHQHAHAHPFADQPHHHHG
jgi:cobalt/nickel transport system ATP-binding protein